MNRRILTLGTLLCVLTSALIANSQDEKKKKRRFPAQGQRIVIRTSSGNNALLRMKVVKEDLKITPEQNEKLTAAFKQAGQALQGLNLQNIPRAELAAKFREINKKNAEAQKELSKQVAEILNKEQKTRFEEIAIQRMGVAALNNKKVAEKLKITDEQKEKLAAIFSKRQKAGQAIMASLRSGDIQRGELNQKLQKIQREAQQDTIAVLTGEQKAAFEKLKGKNIKLPPPQRIRPGQLQLRRGVPKKKVQRDDL